MFTSSGLPVDIYMKQRLLQLQFLCKASHYAVAIPLIFAMKTRNLPPETEGK